MRKSITNNYIIYALIILLSGCTNNKMRVNPDFGANEYLINNEQEINQYLNTPKTGQKVTFKITHENHSDLSNYYIIINLNSAIYYYGPYREYIEIYMSNDYTKKYCLELSFRLIDKKKDITYYYNSDLCYRVLDTEKDIMVKLLGEYQTIKGKEISYKLTGCPNMLDD